jgi:protein-disulfide isomerase
MKFPRLLPALLLAASAVTAAESSPKRAISDFFSGWIRWAPGSRVEVGEPLAPGDRYTVFPIVRKSSVEKLNDRLATVWDSEKKELFVGEVLYAPEAKSTEPFDAEKEGADLRTQLATMSRMETGIRRTPELDRPGLLAYRVVFRTPIGPYGQPILASEDRTMLLIGGFVPAGTDPRELRRSRLSKLSGPRRGNGATVIHEFLDLECPRCAVRSKAVSKFLAEAPELDAAVEIHHFPLYPEHAWAAQAAQSAACLGKLDSAAFFRYVDATFDAQATTTEESAKSSARDAAESLGRAEEFGRCLSSRAGDALVLGEIETAIGAGIRTTPAFVVDGVLVPNDDGLLEQFLRERTRGKPAAPSGKKGGGKKR